MKKMYARSAVLLFRCFMAGANKNEGLTFLRYMNCVLPLDKEGGALRFLCLQCLKAGSAKKKHDAAKKTEDIDAVAAVDRTAVISSQKTTGKGHVCRENVAVDPFRTKLP